MAASDAREAAVRLLARREHSALELRRKLEQRGFDAKDAELAIDRLASEGLQSDDRYAKEFVLSRVSRRYGPIRIRGELHQRGIDDGLASQALDAAAVDWVALVKEALTRLPDPGEDFAGRAKLSQKLSRRGFTGDQIRRAMADHSTGSGD